MQYGPFGPKGQHVSMIGMGTWCIDLADRDTAIRALRSGLDHGMKHIDTAEMCMKLSGVFCSPKP
jgi:diketogulonate reductase-like aldo/keto reductase